MKTSDMVLLGGAALLLLNRPTTPPGGGGGGGGGDTGLAAVANVNVGLSNPINKFPGDTISVVSYSFDYKGPAQKLQLWFALKPNRCPGFGCGFANGDNIPITTSGGASFGVIGTTVQASQQFVNYASTRASGITRATVQQTGIPLQARGGHTVEFNEGKLQAWLGITPGLLNPFVESAMLYGPQEVNTGIDVANPLAVSPLQVVFQ